MVLVLSFSAVVVCLLAAIGSVLCPTFDLVGARLGRPVGAPGMGLVASLPAANVKYRKNSKRESGSGYLPPAMLNMLLLLDLVRFVLGPASVSALAFLALRPVSRSSEPSLGLLERVPG